MWRPRASVVRVGRPALPAVVAWSNVEVWTTLVCASAVPAPVHELKGDGGVVPDDVQLRVTDVWSPYGS